MFARTFAVCVVFAVLAGCGYNRHAPWRVALPAIERTVEVVAFSRGSDPGYLRLTLHRPDGTSSAMVQTKSGNRIVRMSLFAGPKPTEYWILVDVQYGPEVLLRVGKERVAEATDDDLRRAMGDLYLRACRWEACKCADGQSMGRSIPTCVQEKSPAIVAPWTFETVTGPSPR